jgi:type II secretory pathway component PulM
MMFEAQIGQMRERWERLSPRERTLLTALAATFLVMFAMISGFLILDGLSTLDDQNSASRDALHDIETQREAYLKAKAKAAQLEARMGKTPVQLQGFLEQVAKDTGVQIPETTAQQPVPAGKQFMERSVDIRLKQVTLESLSKFLHGVENGPNLVIVSALNIRTRDDKHEELDVELTVTTYERAAEKKDKSGAKKDDKS